MFGFHKFTKCRECPYKLGILKSDKNPCLDCVVYGGKSDVPELWKKRLNIPHKTGEKL